MFILLKNLKQGVCKKLVYNWNQEKKTNINLLLNNMSKTVLITGASTGIGKATAVLFQQRGGNVAATMRSPDPDILSNLENLLCLRLDVTEPASIQQAINQTFQQFNSIDVVVNNAGYGVLGVFEACPANKIEQQFATNVFGLMDVTKAILPHFVTKGMELF